MPERRLDPDALEVLAARLAANYFDVSYGYVRGEGDAEERVPDGKRDADARRVFKPDARALEGAMVRPGWRNIAVVGAGASFGCFGAKKLPLAKDAIPRIKKYLNLEGVQEAMDKVGHKAEDEKEGSGKRFESPIAVEEERFDALYRPPNGAANDFESQLAILSKLFTPAQVRAALRSIYFRRYYPHLAFSVLAHLFKHRFIDVIINFNFDELLDQAIAEELGEGDYRRVISDGDAGPLHDFVIERQIKVPLYIKPHGTISHPSTLRFTKDAYLGLPYDLRDLLVKVVGGRLDDDVEQPERDLLRTNLIAVGFSFGGVDLNRILSRLAGAGNDAPQITIFHFNIDRTCRAIDDGKVPQFRDPPLEAIHHRYVPVDEPAAWASDEARGQHPTAGQGLAGALLRLYQRTAEQFDVLYQPRHLARHHIVHALHVAEHGDHGKRIPDEAVHFYLARLCVEVAISLANGNGRIDTRSLENSRIGTYFEEWRRAYEKGKKDKETGADAQADTAGHATPALAEAPPASLLDVLRWFGCSQSAPSGPVRNDVGCFGGVWSLPPPAKGFEGAHVDAVPDQIADRLFIVLRDRIDDAAFRSHVEAVQARPPWEAEAPPLAYAGDPPPPARSCIHGWLRSLYRSDSSTINPRFGRRRLIQYQRPERDSVIHTNLALTLRFQERLEEPWDLALAVSEQGKVVEKLAEHLQAGGAHDAKRRGVAIVVAHSPRQGLVDARLGAHADLIGGRQYVLPFWAHNRHLIAFLKREDQEGAWSPVGGISFRRPGLSRRVNPVHVTDAWDVWTLVNQFFEYVAKAGPAHDLSSGSRADFVPTAVPHVSVDEVVRTRELLLDEWWGALGSDAAPDG